MASPVNLLFVAPLLYGLGFAVFLGVMHITYLRRGEAAADWRVTHIQLLTELQRVAYTFSSLEP